MMFDNWLKNELSELGIEYPKDDLQAGIEELVNHSMLTVTLLARFKRRFGRVPNVVEFLREPNIKLLSDCIKEC